MWWLVPTDKGWGIYRPGDHEARAYCPADDTAAPAAWVAADAVVFGVGGEVRRCTLDAEGRLGEAALVAVFEGRVVGLLGPLGGREVLVATAPPRSTSYDVFFLSLDTGLARRLAAMSSPLDVEAVPWRGGYACVGNGMQSTEVRFLWPSGAWRARTNHPAPVRGVAVGEGGAIVSFDRDGDVLIWEGDPPGASRGGALDVPADVLKDPGVEACHDVGRGTMMVASPREPGLYVSTLSGERVGSVPYITGCPRGVRGLVVPFATAQGWVWIDTHFWRMPEAWRVSPGWAGPGGLNGLPFVSGEALGVGDEMSVRVSVPVVERLGMQG